MIELDSLAALRTEMRQRGIDDARLVDTDGGNNKFPFDPFLIQVVRVVDSSHNEYCLEVVSPTSDVKAIGRRHRAANGTPLTALGRMMEYLGAKTLSELSP